jgi:hypothetical protein
VAEEFLLSDRKQSREVEEEAEARYSLQAQDSSDLLSPTSPTSYLDGPIMPSRD